MWPLTNRFQPFVRCKLSCSICNSTDCSWIWVLSGGNAIPLCIFLQWLTNLLHFLFVSCICESWVSFSGIFDDDTSAEKWKIVIAWIPYSGKLSREKTFANFAVLWLLPKFSLRNLRAWFLLARHKRAIRKSFFHKNLFTNSRKFSPSNVSCYYGTRRLPPVGTRKTIHCYQL